MPPAAGDRTTAAWPHQNDGRTVEMEATGERRGTLECSCGITNPPSSVPGFDETDSMSQIASAGDGRSEEDAEVTTFGDDHAREEGKGKLDPTVCSKSPDGEAGEEKWEGAVRSDHYITNEEISHEEAPAAMILTKDKDGKKLQRSSLWGRRPAILAILLIIVATALASVMQIMVKEQYSQSTPPEIQKRHIPRRELGGTTASSFLSKQTKQCRSWCQILPTPWYDNETGEPLKCSWVFHCGGCGPCDNDDGNEDGKEITPYMPVLPEDGGKAEEDGEDSSGENKPCDEEVCYDLSHETEPVDTCRWDSCVGCPECRSDPITNEDLADNPYTSAVAPSRNRTSFAFYVLADTPYDYDQLRSLPRRLREMNDTGNGIGGNNGTEEAEDAAFVVFLGDMQRPKYSKCSSLQYKVISHLFRTYSPYPMLVLPGDNDYNDCPSPEDAWKRFESNFGPTFINHWDYSRHGFGGDDDENDEPAGVANITSSWEDRIRWQSQQNVTNFVFLYRRVLFLSVNLLGGTVHDEKEWKRRHENNVRWVKSNLAVVTPRDHHEDEERMQEKKSDPKARHKPHNPNSYDTIVIFGHARPKKKKHRDFFEIIADDVEATEKPTWYIHGDGHVWHVKRRPFKIDNLIGVQVGAGLSPALRVTVLKADNNDYKDDENLDGSAPSSPSSEASGTKETGSSSDRRRNHPRRQRAGGLVFSGHDEAHYQLDHHPKSDT